MGNIESGIGIIDPIPSDEEDNCLFEPLGREIVQKILRMKQNDPIQTGFQIMGTFSELDNDVWFRLGEIIGQNEILQVLTIISCHSSLSSVRANGLNIGLQSARTIQRLNLEGIDLRGEEMMHGLALFLTQNPSLETVRFVHCNLGCDALSIMADALLSCPHKNLKAIHMQGNQFGDNDMDKLAHALSGLRGIARLDLRNNGIGQRGCESLARLLKKRSSNLQSLDLSQNRIDNECIDVLAGALNCNSRLWLLHLDQNYGIKSAGWSALMKLVCDTSSIKGLVESNHSLVSFGSPCNSVMVRETVEHALGTKSANRLRSSLCANASGGVNAMLAARFKIVYSFARGDLKIGRASIPMGIVPSVLAWIEDCANELLRYRRPLLSEKAIAAAKLDSIFRILRSDPALVTASGMHTFEMQDQLKC